MGEFLKVNGNEIETPESCTYSLLDLSSEKSGRNSLTGENYKDIIAQKRKLTCRWNSLPVEQAHQLAQAMKMSGATVQVTYFDIAEFAYLTKEFTTGDFTCSYLSGWTSTRRFVGDISCNFIEK